uniref:EF-hand domain-containing protein n=2 Tax=Hemiselmis andersenii TaxID=464988 RepID=A0A7S0UC96_HEMAN
MDRDGSGSLSTQEVYEGLNSVGIAVAVEEVEKMVAAADTDGVDGVSEGELLTMMRDVAEGKGVMRTAFRQGGAWLPGFIAQPLVALLEFIGRLDDKQDRKLQGKVRPYDMREASGEMLELRGKLSQLVLDNDAVWKREENRREQIRTALERAKKETSGATDRGDLVSKLSQTESPGIILGPYFLLCWILDVLFTNRPIQRFWFLENVARMPYLSYSTMLAYYEVLGWWRASSDVRLIHFAEEWNEVQHLKIMEALGGDRLWLDRFLARHAAVFYYIILNHAWLISPSAAYNFSELIEFHAVDTYGEFLDANEELLKSMPAPQEAIDYYESDDLFLFDEFQTGREPSTRRPRVNSLYDVFMNIRDDELEHVKTMFECQTAEVQIMSPNSRKQRVEKQTASR